jgi:hypothetical protein
VLAEAQHYDDFANVSVATEAGGNSAFRVWPDQVNSFHARDDT